MPPKKRSISNSYRLPTSTPSLASSPSQLNLDLGGGSTMFINPLDNPSIDPMYACVNLDDDDDIPIDENVDRDQSRLRKSKGIGSTSSQQQGSALSPTSRLSTNTSSERTKTSWVWEHFEGDSKKEKAKCKHCLNDLSYKTGLKSTGTGHLQRHLINVHHLSKDKGGGDDGLIQTTLDAKTGKYFNFNKSLYLIETMKFTIGCSLPFTFANGWRYKKWIGEAVNPLADRIPRTSMRTLAFKYFKEQKEIIASTVDALDWKVCLTSDIAKFREFDIMCVTLHWIDINWVLQRRIVYFRSIAKHNAIQITDGLLECMKEFKMTKKIMAISFDNASANTASIENLRVDCSVEFSHLFHTRCLCHILQLVAKDGIEVIWNEFISPIRNAVLLIINSGAKKSEYKELVVRSGKRFKKLLMDVETRWNSTYDLLVRAYLFKDEISLFYEKNRPKNEEFYPPLTSLHWTYCHELVFFLAPFKDFTHVFSTQYNPNIHMSLEAVVNLAMHLHQFRDQYVCKDMVPNMEEKFLKYFHPIPYAYAIGCILCPTLKIKGFHTLVRCFYDSLLPFNEEIIGDYDINKYQIEVETYLYKMYAKYVNKYREITSTSGGTTTFGSNISTKIRPRHNHLRKILQQNMSNSPSEDSNELTRYFETQFDVGMYNEETPIDVLQWWSSRVSTFPTLSRLARDVFSIPMSSVASESAFSQAKLQYTAKRSRLTSSSVEVCVAIKDWTAAEHRMQDKEAAMEEHNKEMFDELSDIEEQMVEEGLVGDDDGDSWFDSEDEIPEEEAL